MRLLPIAALVLTSLIFTVGGVAIIGRADSASQTSNASTPAAPLFEAKPVETGCAQPQHHDVRIPANRFAIAGDTIQLNTRGYNYAAPGEIQIDPTGRTKPSEALPPAAPAAPAAKPPTELAR
jgi:hypothetical protein